MVGWGGAGGRKTRRKKFFYAENTNSLPKKKNFFAENLNFLAEKIWQKKPFEIISQNSFFFNKSLNFFKSMIYKIYLIFLMKQEHVLTSTILFNTINSVYQNIWLKLIFHEIDNKIWDILK